MEIVCQHCGRFLSGIHAERGQVVSVRCPGCGAETICTVGASPETASGDRAGKAGEGGRGPAAARSVRPTVEPGEEGYATLFRAETLGSALDPGGAMEGEGAPGSTVLARSADFAPPPAQLDRGAYFLVLGAKAERERIHLSSSRTVFGREEADVDLGDPAVSSHHFQIEIMGADCFIRDLESRNGTYVNGRRVRYMELLPGDEVRAGRTILVFLTAKDSRTGRG